MRRIFAHAAFGLIYLLFSTALTAQGLHVKTLQGTSGNLTDHLSEKMWTLVMVWTTYCGECAKQYDKISTFHENNKSSRLQVLGVSLDGFNEKTKVRQYALTKKHAFPSILAESKNFANKYSEITNQPFTGTPTYLLFDRTKSLQAYMDGPITVDALERFLSESDFSKS